MVVFALVAIVATNAPAGAHWPAMPTAPHRAHHHRVDPRTCRFQFRDGRAGWSVGDVARTIRCVAWQAGVSSSTALGIAERESHLSAAAVNRSSGACGVFQHIPRYFASRLAAVPRRYRPTSSSCLNARSNILAALWLVARYGWGPWGL